MKTVVDSVTLSELINDGLNELEAYQSLHRMREVAHKKGECITRQFKNGKLWVQTIWKYNK